MDYKKVGLSLFVAIAIGFTFYSFSNEMSTTYAPYGGATVNTSFYNDDFTATDASLQSMSENTVGASESGGVSSDEVSASIGQARSTFGIVRDMIGFVPRLLTHGASILGVPSEYQTWALLAFGFAFAITLAYLLLLGVKNL